ncbi:uncharacterized protein LOC117111606 isoform X2 [Anneissia japonica]|uniref:uncharacterized protein LOC117111606 isoform X2 n=1 Tax=Anneissia japonica TaxID=1529436 RepID=UPI0014258559|nr:uncharacterized protein LOC117111606 isoform X2 [Anneissia japonica]
MDKGEDGTDGTPKPAPEEGKYFCNICSLDYSTESQFSEHKWSSLHHNQMEKSYGRLEKSPKQRPVSSHARFRNAPHRQMEWSGHYNPQIGNPFTRQNQLYNSFNQPMFRTQPVNQWQAGHSGNNYCYDRRDNHYWQYNGNTKWMNDRSKWNYQVPNSTQNFFVRPPIFTTPLGSNSIQNFVASPPVYTAPQGSKISPKNNAVTTLSAKHDNPINDKVSTSSPEATSSAKTLSNAINSTSHKEFTSSVKVSLEATFSAKDKSNAVNSTDKYPTSFEKATPKATLSAKVKPIAINSNNLKHSTNSEKATPEATLSPKAKSNAINSTNHKDSTSSEKSSTEATLLKKAACETKISMNTKVIPKSISKVTAQPDTALSTKGNKCTTIFQRDSTAPSLLGKTHSNVSNSDIGIKDNTILQKPIPNSALSKNLKSTEGSKYKSVFQKQTQNDTKMSESSDTGFIPKATTNSLTKIHEMHSRKNVDKADDSLSERCIFRNSIAIGSGDNSKPDDIQEKLVTNALVPKGVPNKDRSISDVSCHLSSDLTKHSRPTDNINAEMNINSETNREPSLSDILKKDLETRKELSLSDTVIKHISKSLKPNIGASRSRLHAGMRTQIENTETTLQQKLVQILSLSKSKHTQETEIAKLKQISGPQKRFRKRYGLQFGSCDGQTDDMQENSENQLLEIENLSDCNFTDMKIHEDPELMAQLKAFAEDGEKSNFCDDLSAIDINSGRSTTPSTFSTTGVCIKQELIEPLENVVQEVTNQVYEPTNISENLSSMKEKSKRVSKSDKQSKSNNLLINSKQCYQQNQLSVVSEDLPFVDIISGKTSTRSTSSTTPGVCIKQEPIEPLEDVVQKVTKQVYEPTNILENLSSGMQGKYERISKTDKQKKPNNLPIDSKQCYQKNQLPVVSEDLPFVDINSGNTSTPSISSTVTGVFIKQEPLEDVVQKVIKQVYKHTDISESPSSGMKEKCKRVSKTDKQNKTNNLLIDSKHCYQQNQLPVVSEDLPFVDINSSKTRTPSTSSTPTGACMKQEPIEPLEDDVQNVTKQVYKPTDISESLSSGMKEKCKRVSKSDKKKKTDSKHCYQQNQLPVVSEDLPFVDINSSKTSTPSTSSTLTGACMKHKPIEPLEDVVQKVTKQVNELTNFSKNLSSGTKEKISKTFSNEQKETNNLQIDLRQYYQHNQMPDVSKNLHFLDVNSVKTATSSTSSTTGEAISDKQKKPHNFAIESSHSYQQNQVSLVTGIQIKKESLAYSEAAYADTNTFFEASSELSVQTDAAIKTKNVSTTDFDILRENIYQQTHNIMSMEKSDLMKWKNRNNSSGIKAQQDREIIVNRKVENGQSAFTKIDASSKYSCKVQLERLDMPGVVKGEVTAIQEDCQISAVSKEKQKTEDGVTRRKTDTHKGVERVFSGAEGSHATSDLSLVRCSQSSPVPVEVGSSCAAEKLKTMDQTSAAAGIQSDLEKLFNISLREESLHQKMKEMEKNIQKLKDVILKNQMDLNNVQSAKQQLDGELQSLRGMRMNILEGARGRGEDMSSLPKVEKVSNRKRQYTADVFRNSLAHVEPEIIKDVTDKDNEISTTFKESQVKKPCSTRVEQKKYKPESQLVRTDASCSDADTTSYPPAIVLSTGDQNIDMQSVISVLSNPHILQQIQYNFNQLNQMPTEPEKEALIVTIPENGSVPNAAPEDHAMEEDPLEEKVSDKKAIIFDVPKSGILPHFPPYNHTIKEKKETRKLRKKRKVLSSDEDNLEGPMTRNSKRIKTMRESKILAKKTLMEEPECCIETTSKKKSCNTPAIDPKGHTHLSKKPSETRTKQTSKQVGKRKSDNLSGKDSEEAFSEESSDKDPGTSRKLRVKPSPIEYPAKKRSSKLPKKQAENLAQLDTKETPKLSKKSEKKERSSPKKDNLTKRYKKLGKNIDKQSLLDEMMNEANLRFINCDEELLKIEIMEGNLYCVCRNNAVKAYSLESCQLKGTYTASDAEILSIAFVKTTLFVSYADQKLCEFDLETQKCIYEYHCSSNVICMHSNWEKLYVGMFNGIIAVVNSKKHELITKNTVNKDVPLVYITSTVRDAAKVLIVANYMISIIDEKTGSLIAKLNTHLKADVIYMNLIGERLYTADTRGFLYVNNVNSPERRSIALDSSLTSFQITEQYIITASEKRSVFKFIDKKGFKVRLQYAVNGTPLRCVLVHQETLIIGGKHGLVCLYDPWDHFWSKEYLFYPKRMKAYGCVRDAEKKRKFLLQTI